jgi:small subunit ribosomal protein S6
MRLYENIFILRPDLEGDRTDQVIEQVQKMVVRGGGEVKNIERWGKKRLAYKVNKERYGYYVLMHFEGNPELVRELERNYGHWEDVIRYLTIRIKKGEPIKVEMEPEEFEEQPVREKPAIATNEETAEQTEQPDEAVKAEGAEKTEQDDAEEVKQVTEAEPAEQVEVAEQGGTEEVREQNEAETAEHEEKE